MSSPRPWLRSLRARSSTAASPAVEHPALARDELLVGIEGERRRMLPRAPTFDALGVDRAERLAGVLDDAEPVRCGERARAPRMSAG